MNTRSVRLSTAIFWGLSLAPWPLCAGEIPDKPRQIGDEHWRQGSGPLNDSDIEQLARGVAYRGGTTPLVHPLVGVPKLIIETDGDAKPRKLLADAAAKLADMADKLKKEFKKIK